MNPADVGVTNSADDQPGITVTPPHAFPTRRSSDLATFTVVLRTQPIANVTIGLSSSDPSEGTVAPASLTLTWGHWNSGQSVTSTGADDFGVDGSVAYTIVTAAATSTDGIYNGMDPA